MNNADTIRTTALLQTLERQRNDALNKEAHAQAEVSTLARSLAEKDAKIRALEEDLAKLKAPEQAE